MLLIICIVATLLPAQIFAVDTQSKTDTVSLETKNPYSDVKENDWFYENVMYALKNGLFTGISDTKFNSNGAMTRGMFVTVIGRIVEINVEDYKDETEFSDVASNSWYDLYIIWTKQKGVADSVGDGNVNPKNKATRAEGAAFLTRVNKHLIEVGFKQPDKKPDTDNNTGTTTFMR